MNSLKLIEIVDKADKDYALAMVPADTLKKFAKMIVEECVSVLETRKDHAVVVNAIKEINEYFGVER